LLAYNCSPSFNWKKNLDDATIAGFQRELAAMGYKFQFITLAGFHTLNFAMFELARGYKQAGMTAYSRLQEKEFLREQQAGYEAVKHQRFVGTGYFDAVQQVITSGAASTMALEGSTEEAQFSGAGNRSMEDSNLGGKPDPNHAITVPVAIVDPLTADPSLMATCWEASDELMPSGD
jgi:isocitrate lyase